MQAKAQEQQKVVNEIVSSKLFAPKEKRVGHAQAVNSYGEQEKMSIAKPSHVGRLSLEAAGASGKWFALA
jgi:hypothetical protein